MKKIFYLLLILTLMVSCDKTQNIKDVTKESDIPYIVTVLLKDSTEIKEMNYVETDKSLFIITEDKEIIKSIKKESDGDTLILFFSILTFVFGFVFGILVSY